MVGERESEGLFSVFQLNEKEKGRVNEKGTVCLHNFHYRKKKRYKA